MVEKLGLDLLLDPTTHDLVLVGNDIALRADVSQAVKIRLLKVRGEWFRNTEAGVPYFDGAEIKGRNVQHILAEIRTTILETPGVGEITQFDHAINPSTRKLSVTWRATIDSGEIAGVSEF